MLKGNFGLEVGKIKRLRYTKNMKIALLLSGGVDSSVALARLIEDGCEVTAFYLKIWLEDELAHLGSCPWQEDLSYVRATCQKLNVPLEIISLQKEYWNEVVAYTIAQIKAGLTPNPDVMCNQCIKFGAFMRAIGDDYDAIATGHYAQTVGENGLVKLKRAPDPIKDQTYFLAHLSQAQLRRAWFPIGHLHKKQVRELAYAYDLPTKDRKDSQGICFLGKLKFSEFVRHHVGTNSGNFIEYETGKIVGRHEGFWFFTIGQRQGMRLAGGPWYVVAKQPQTNTVYVSRNYHASDKVRKTFRVTNFNWISGIAPQDGQFLIKLRHGPGIVSGSMQFDDQGGTVTLQERDQGIAPGQFAVFYHDDICLGSAVIAQGDVT